MALETAPGSWLAVALTDVCAAKGWTRRPQTTLDLTATDERIVPDLLVYPDDQSIAGQRPVPADRALLVVEVVSQPSERDDDEGERESCAKNGIPMYLIVDPFDATLTLCTEPSANGYRLIHIVDAGGELYLPEPFGITLDTSTIPIKSTKG